MHHVLFLYFRKSKSTSLQTRTLLQLQLRERLFRDFFSFGALVLLISALVKAVRFVAMHQYAKTSGLYHLPDICRAPAPTAYEQVVYCTCMCIFFLQMPRRRGALSKGKVCTDL